MTIMRIWRGWTTPENAEAYRRIVTEEVIPAIEARRIPGFEHIDVLRVSPEGRPANGEVEFATIMIFRSAADIAAFVGPDVTRSHVPAAAQAVLSRYDERAVHYDVLDRRPQPA